MPILPGINFVIILRIVHNKKMKVSVTLGTVLRKNFPVLQEDVFLEIGNVMEPQIVTVERMRLPAPPLVLLDSFCAAKEDVLMTVSFVMVMMTVVRRMMKLMRCVDVRMMISSANMEADV